MTTTCSGVDDVALSQEDVSAWVFDGLGLLALLVTKSEGIGTLQV